MIRKVQYFITEEKNPYKNLALEETLLHQVEPDACILYLWQNENTVVIGKNQNMWQECRVQELTRDGGFPTRRMSGGGAVFHDLGNLNFTFLMHQADFDVSRQCKVITEALKNLGIKAEQSGRNDILVDGRKISGNAFYRSGDRCYHHGTILLRTDKEKLEKYLSVSRDKLQSKGVESVKSRVANLCEFLPDLTIGQLQEALLESLGQVYQLPVRQLGSDWPDPAFMEASFEKFSSWDWVYGRKITFRDVLKRRFPWGSAEIGLDVEGGVIADCQVYSDAMDVKLPERISEALKGCRFLGEQMKERIQRLGEENPEFQYAVLDICQLFEEVE